MIHAGEMHMVILLLLTALAQAQAVPPGTDGRDSDRAAIRAHIEGICQAFVDGDITKIHATHTEDWRGFLEGSRTPIKGIDAYMRANGIPWPQPAGTVSKPVPNPTRTFKVFNFDVHFYSADLAVANFHVDFGNLKDGEFTTGTRYRIMDIYARRNGEWNQAASHTVVDPGWKAEQQSLPGTLPVPIRDQLLAAREALWRAYFTNDQAALDKLMPEETIELGGSFDKPFVRKPDIMRSAQQAAQQGLKLMRLEFPQTEIQVYGTTAIIYTTYLYTLQDAKGEERTSTGKATEVFVRRANGWVNPGWQMAGAK